MESENKTNGVIIDGVEYLNQRQAARLAGISVITFKSKVEKFKIEKNKRPSGLVLYRLNDIMDAIANGWLNKWNL